MRFRAVLVCLAAALSLTGVAWGDIVHLRDGGRLVGEVEAKGNTLTVTNKYGSSSVPLSAVRLIEKAPTVLGEYQKLASGAGPQDVGAQKKVADFCRKHQLASRERYHLLRVLRLRPDDLQARSRLGYIMSSGVWLTKSEEMKNRGLTRFRGKWVTPDEKQAVAEQEHREKLELAAKRRREREERLAMLKSKRLAQAEREREASRERQGHIGITSTSRRDRDSTGYSGYYRRSLLYPYGYPYYYNPYYRYYRYHGSGTRHYRSGYYIEYRSGNWVIRW